MEGGGGAPPRWPNSVLDTRAGHHLIISVLTHPRKPSRRFTGPILAGAVLTGCAFLSLRLLLAHNPLSHALQLGADLAKQKALEVIPPEWMGGLAQPLIQVINQYVGPYELAGQAFMGSTALGLALVAPLGLTLLAGLLIHGGLLLTGGALGGWKATTKIILQTHATADLATLLSTWLLLVAPLTFLPKTLLLLVGLLAVRLGSQIVLLVSLARVHQLSAVRVIFLGLPSVLIGFGLGALVALGSWLWYTCDLALSVITQP